MQAAPLHEDVARAPPGGEAWWVATRDGESVRVAGWPAAPGTPARGTVLMFPGRTEYIEKYGPPARWFTDAGFTAAVIDWRGQGLTARTLSDRRLGHVEHFAEYQHDVGALLNLAGWLEFPEPYFLVAHSMGGCIGLRALHEGLPVRAAAFSAPMWGIRFDAWEVPLAWISGLFAPLLGLGGTLAPRTTIEHLLLGGRFQDNTLTTDREMWTFMKAQLDRYPDLALGGPTLSWLRAALLETGRLSRLPSPTTPAVTFLGSDERIVSRPAIRRRMAHWATGRLELAEGAQHEIMMERPEVRDRFRVAATTLFLENS